MKLLQVQSVVWKEGRHYVAQCLNVDVSSFGSTRRAALKNLDEAVDLYFEDHTVPRITKVEKPGLASRGVKLRAMQYA